MSRFCAVKSTACGRAPSRRVLSGLAILLGASGLALLTGCGATMNLAAGSPSSGSTGAAITGKVYGGQAPVVGATVTLYAAGTAGYGSAPTAIPGATTTTGAGGSFTIPSYTCPAAPGDLTFLLATGGNPGSGTNAQLVQMAALGSCNATGFTSQFVFMDEVTTVASAYAMAQFISYTPNQVGVFPTSSPAVGQVPYIGIPTSSCPTSTATTPPWLSTGAKTCNYLGLQNAMATVQNLVCYANGVAPPDSIPYNYYIGGTGTAPANCDTGTGDTSAGHTGYAPSSRINTIANALSACVNSTSGSGSSPSANCAALFAAVTPSANGSPQTSAAAPSDTLQAVSFLAQYPQLNSTNGPALIELVPAVGAPFSTPASMKAAPNDWTLALGYTGGGFGNAGAISTTANGLAIDQQGNLWAASAADNGTTNNGAIVEFNNQGTPQSPATTSTTAWGGFANPGNAGPANAPFQPAVAVNGNVYFVNTGASTLAGITNSGGSLLSPVTLNQSPVGSYPLGVALDPSGNIWVEGVPTAGSGAGVQEYSNTGSALSSHYENDGAAGVGYNSLALVNPGNAWATNPSTQSIWFDTVSGDYQLSTTGTVDHFFSGSANEGQLSANSAGDVYGCNFAHIYEDEPPSTVVTVSTTNGCNTGSSFAPNAFDGAGNLWEPVVSGGVTGTIGHLDETIATGGNAGSVLSPAKYGYQGIGSPASPTGDGEPNVLLLTQGTTNDSSIAGTAVDGSGNVWVLNGVALPGTANHQLVEFVGLGAPTVTPTVLAVQYNTFTTLP